MKKIVFVSVLVLLLIIVSGCTQPPVCGNGTCEIGEDNPNTPVYCKADCTPQPPAELCVEKLNIETDSKDYFVGDEALITISAFNEKGGANAKVEVVTYLNGNKEATWITTENGYFKKIVKLEKTGEYSMLATVPQTETCNGLETKANFTVKEKACAATLSAVWDKKDYKTGDKFLFTLTVLDQFGKGMKTKVDVTVFLDNNKVGSSSYDTNSQGLYTISGQFTNKDKNGTYAYTFVIPATKYCKAVQTSTAFSLNVKQTCTDTDGGKDYYKKGTVNVTFKTYYDSYVDYCTSSNSQLQERYCNGAIASNLVYNCPKGCKDGACIK